MKFYNPKPKSLPRYFEKYGGTIKDYLEELEDNLILWAIIKAKATILISSAMMLGINRTTMVMKFFRLREYGIDVGAYRDPKDKSEENPQKSWHALEKYW